MSWKSLIWTGGILYAVAVGVIIYLVIALVMANSTSSPSEPEDSRSQYPAYNPDLLDASRIPQWSADGQTLVVNVNETIYGIDLASGKRWEILPGRDDAQYSPSLSSTGQLAFANFKHTRGFFRAREQRHIMATTLDGEKAERISANLRFPSVPVWSPDGSHLAFIDHVRGTDLDMVVVVTPDNSDSGEILLQKPSLPQPIRSISWSNDSQRLALLVGKWGNYAIVTVNVTGNEEGVVAHITEFPYRWGQLSLPDWSPDDQRLYFGRREQGRNPEGGPSNPLQLVSTRVDGSDPRVIVDFGTDFTGWIEHVQMSPNGNRLSFITRFDDTADEYIYLEDQQLPERDPLSYLYAVNVDGTDLVELDSSYIDGASWSPTGDMLAVHDFGSDRKGSSVYTFDANTLHKTQW